MMNIFEQMRKILFFIKIKNKRTKPDTSLSIIFAAADGQTGSLFPVSNILPLLFL